MTVRLLVPFNGLPAGATVTGYDEAYLIDTGQAVGVGSAYMPANPAVNVSAGQAGVIYTLRRTLGNSSVFTLRSGSDVNLSIVGGNQISATAGIAAGASQVALVRETNGTGNATRIAEYSVTLTGQVTGALPVVSSVIISTLGDSYSNWTAANSGVLDQRTVVLPAFNGTAQQIAMDRWKSLLMSRYPAARFSYNGGISGETTTQILARSQASPSATRKAIEDVIGVVPDLIIARCGSPNDIITQSAAALTQAYNDGVISRHMQIITALANSGIQVLDEGIAGYNGDGGTSAPDLAARRAALVYINAGISAAHAALNNNRLRYLEPSGITHDGTGAFISGYSDDGTHLNLNGGTAHAKREEAILVGWIGPSATYTWSGPNLVSTEAAFPVTSVQSYGVAPDPTYFDWGAASSTRQNATMNQTRALPDGTVIPVSTCEFIGAASGTPQAVFNIRIKALLLDNARLVLGDTFSIEMYYWVEFLSGTTALGSNPVVVRAQFGQSGTDNVAVSSGRAAVPIADILTDAGTGLGLPKIKIPVTGTLTAADTFVRLSLGIPLNGGIRVIVGGLRIVKQ